MAGRSQFENRYGFSRADVSLENWRLAPYSAWAFQNVCELVPCAVISAGLAPAEGPPADAAGLLAERIEFAGGPETVAGFLRRSGADALVVMKAGRFVADYHAPHHDFRARHLVFSISKSLTAVVAGVVNGDGLLDPEAPVTDYVPEVAGSAYGDASVRDLLDMRVSLDFGEDDPGPESVVARYRHAMLWHPRQPGSRESLFDVLRSIRRGPAPHGGAFRYRSPNSDLLGIVVERASGQRLPDLMSRRLWRPIGATTDGEVTIDREGTARAAAGVSMSARDLARVGELMRRDGASAGGRVLPQAWVRDTREGGSAEAWRRGDFPHLVEKGRYRNNWYQTGDPGGAFFAIGSHGQWLYVDPAAETVIVKFSSQPVPVDNALDQDSLVFFKALSQMV